MPQQLYGTAERQPHDGIVVALDTVQPEGRTPLNGISPSLIVRLFCGGIERDLLLAQREEGHFTAVHKTLGTGAVRDAHTGVHLMGGAGEGAQHPLCVLHAVGFAEYFTAHIHHGVAADDNIARVLCCHGEAFAPGQLFYKTGRGVGCDRTFVKVAGTDREIGRVFMKK